MLAGHPANVREFFEALQRSCKSQILSFDTCGVPRKFEEGLSSAIDLQTAANTLLEARANLLQKLLSYEIKRRLVEYYKEGIL